MNAEGKIAGKNWFGTFPIVARDLPYAADNLRAFQIAARKHHDRAMNALRVQQCELRAVCVLSGIDPDAVIAEAAKQN